MSRIKEVRDYYKLSMTKFSERLGVSPSSISLLESGKRNLTVQMAKLIAKEYEVNEMWLLTGEGSMLDPVEPEDELAQLAAEIYHMEPDSWEFQIVRKIARIARTASVEELKSLLTVIQMIADEEE